MITITKNKLKFVKNQLQSRVGSAGCQVMAQVLEQIRNRDWDRVRSRVGRRVWDQVVIQIHDNFNQK
jgi:hypothetical protein